MGQLTCSSADTKGCGSRAWEDSAGDTRYLFVSIKRKGANKKHEI